MWNQNYEYSPINKIPLNYGISNNISSKAYEKPEFSQLNNFNYYNNFNKCENS